MGEWFGAFHLHSHYFPFYLPFFVLAMGVFAIRVLGGGEDWYDVWTEGGHYGWFGDFGECFRCVWFSTLVIVGLGFLWAVTPGALRTPDPSYEESTPIKVASAKVVSSTPAKLQKKHTKKKKATAKRHVGGQTRVSQ